MNELPRELQSVMDKALAAEKLNLDGQAFVDYVGGQEAFDTFQRYLEYMHEHPAKIRGNVLEIARYIMPDPNQPFDVKHSRYKVKGFHALIADAFGRVLRGECLNLILSVPPQHGKSTLARALFSAHIGEYPHKHLMMGAYNETFANDYGDKVRAILTGEQFKRIYPGVELRKAAQSKDHMVTTEGGEISFLGRGGSGTGRPADGFLIDDFFKDWAEANSRATRDAAWKWYTSVVDSRCRNFSWQVIIATRWSDDDIIARLTDPSNPHYNPDEAAHWTVINLPAEMDDPKLAEALGMKVGESLWPEEHSLEKLHRRKARDPVMYSALYMGRPTPPEGVFYKQSDIHEYRNLSEFPKRCRMYLTGDLAVSTESGANRSCVGVWGLDEDDTLWLHPQLYWDKKSSDESVETILDHGAQFNVMEAFFEKGQLDKAIGPFLEKRQMEKGAQDSRYHFTLTRLPVAGHKGLRSQSIRGRMRQGKVKFPAGSFAPWWSAAKEELLKFTGSGNDKADDFCDMLSLIGQALGDTIRASTESSNVVNFPKVGTFGWTVRAHKEQLARDARRRALRGM